MKCWQVAALLLSSFALGPTIVLGATGDVAGETSRAEAARAHVRFWFMLPAEVPPPRIGAVSGYKQTLRIVDASASGQPVVLVRKPYPFMISGYLDLTPGKHMFQLTEPADARPPKELCRCDVTLLPNSYGTVVVLQYSGSPMMLFVNESLRRAHSAKAPENSPAPTSKEIVLYNFTPGARVTVECDSPAFTRDIPYGKVARVTALPARILNLVCRGARSGDEFRGEIEADLVTYDSLSFILKEDLYGRAVPAVVPNATKD